MDMQAADCVLLRLVCIVSLAGCVASSGAGAQRRYETGSKRHYNGDAVDLPECVEDRVSRLLLLSSKRRRTALGEAERFAICWPRWRLNLPWSG